MVKNLTGINVEIVSPPIACHTTIKIDGVDVSNLLTAISFRSDILDELNFVSIEYKPYSIIDATTDQLRVLGIEPEVADAESNPV